MEPFVHLPKYCIIVCTTCKHAVLPSHVNAHLKDENKHNATKEERERICQEVQQIEGLIVERAELNKISFPPPSSPPIPILQEPCKDGIKCKLQDEHRQPCQYISCQIQKVQEHCRKVHRWTNKQKRGRPEKGVEIIGP